MYSYDAVLNIHIAVSITSSNVEARINYDNHRGPHGSNVMMMMMATMNATGCFGVDTQRAVVNLNETVTAAVLYHVVIHHV